MKRWLEDFVPGDELTSHGRTVGEAEFLAWGATHHSYASVHFDQELMASTLFGQRIGAGFMSLDLSVGLFGQGDWNFYWPEGAIATEAWEDLRFPAPVLAGDTLRCRRVITDVEVDDDRSGVVVHSVEVVNQRAEIVMTGRERIRVARCGAAGPSNAAAGSSHDQEVGT